ncbi:uncharacterized protein LOC118745741 [Rhagoletis pomonella]|uniref:uncharacterized protein LOC118745741 n=1 Tax=Rhagoletis pomonella TaxID=28610 RepID=UPI001786760F|nr:uncharacterized protein LOC118745741 [Rhagoletis pomonella]
MICRNCQHLVHTKNRCSKPTTCEGCSLPPHSPDTSTRNQCANCVNEHSSDTNCPRFNQMKEVLQIKTIYKCSIGEAYKKYNEKNTLTHSTKSYASKAKISPHLNHSTAPASKPSASSTAPPSHHFLILPKNSLTTTNTISRDQKQNHRPTKLNSKA